MHQEAFPGEDISDRPPPEAERARPARADRGRGCRAGATPPRELAAAPAMSALALRRAREAHEPPEARGSRPRRRRAARRDAARRLARPRALRRAAALPPARATCSSSTPRRRCPPRCPARLGGARVELHLSTPRSAAARWVVELRAPATGAARPRRRPATRVELPGGARARAARAVRRQRAARGWRRLELGAPLAGYLAPPRPPDPLRLRRRPTGRSTPTRPSSRASRAAPRCRAPAGRSRPSSSTELVARGVLVAPLMLHTGVSSLERRRAAVPRALPRPRGDGAARQRRPRAGAAA